MIILLYLVLCFATGAVAIGKNRSFFGFFLLSALFSPIVGLLLVAMVEKK